MSDETTSDLTALAEALHATGLLNLPLADSLDVDCWDAARAALAAGFGPVRAVQAERDAARAFVVEAMQEAGHDLEQAWARAESAEAALTGVVGGVRKWCAINEIAEPPLDWAGLGEFLALAPTPDREEER